MILRQKPKLRIAAAALLGALLAGAPLTACSGAQPRESASSEPTSIATVKPTPEPITGEPGDPLTAAEAKQLNGQRGTLRPYELADGSWIILDFKKPLPEAVKAEVAAAIAQSDPDDLSSFFAANDAQAAKVGKTLVVIRYINASDMSGNYFEAWRATTPSNSFEVAPGATPEAVIAEVEPWIAAQRDPSQYEIIVVEG